MRFSFLKLSIFITIICRAQESTNAYNLDYYLNFSNQNTETLVKKNNLKSSKSYIEKAKIFEENYAINGLLLNTTYYKKNLDYLNCIYEYDSLNQLILAKSAYKERKPRKEEYNLITYQYNSFRRVIKQQHISTESYSRRSKSVFTNEYLFTYSNNNDSIIKEVYINTYNEIIDSSIIKTPQHYKTYFETEPVLYSIADTIISDTIKSTHALLLGGGCNSYYNHGDPVTVSIYKNNQLKRLQYFNKNKLVNTRKYLYLKNGLLNKVIFQSALIIDNPIVTQYKYTYFE